MWLFSPSLLTPCSAIQLLQSDVRPIVPTLSEVLYESVYESQQWMLFDANKKRIAVGDAFPASYNVKALAKGDYVLRLHIRHEDPAQLAKLASMTIVLERPLSKVLLVTQSLHPSRTCDS